MAIEDAIVRAVAEESPDDVVLTKFALVAEVMDADGKRWSWTFTHEGATRWDTYGLLTEGLENEKAAHYAEVVNDD